MKTKIAVLICVVAAFATETSRASEAEAKAAKVKYDQAIAKAQAEMVSAFDQAIKQAAFGDDLAAVKVLILEKEGFVQSGKAPNSPAFTEKLNDYVLKRKSAASDYHRELQRIVTNATNKNDPLTASKYQLQLKAFVSAEKSAIAALTIPRVDIEGDKNRVVGDIDPSEKTSIKQVTDFAELYRSLLTEAHSSDTTARQDREFQIAIKKLQDNLKSQNWTIHREITDVSKYGDKGLYAIKLELPEFGEGRKRTVAAFTDVHYMKLADKQALELGKGDIIIFSGKPVIEDKNDAPGTLMLLRFDNATEGPHQRHYVRLDGQKVTIRKSTVKE
ncbi:MAG: hypothetical protein SGJ20_20580 [Planctomycetota bacterium]|nr:hypothetical protein [Planctomycetota bacterium]